MHITKATNFGRPHRSDAGIHERDTARAARHNTECVVAWGGRHDARERTELVWMYERLLRLFDNMALLLASSASSVLNSLLVEALGVELKARFESAMLRPFRSRKLLTILFAEGLAE